MRAGFSCHAAYTVATRQVRSYGEPAALVAHHKSGGLRFCDEARWQVDDGTSHVEFDDAEAVAMAKRFIEKYSVVPLGEYKLLRRKSRRRGSCCGRGLRSHKRRARTIATGLSGEGQSHGRAGFQHPSTLRALHHAEARPQRFRWRYLATWDGHSAVRSNVSGLRCMRQPEALFSILHVGVRAGSFAPISCRSPIYAGSLH